MFQVGKWQHSSILTIHTAQAESLVKGQRLIQALNAKAHRIFGLKAYSVLVENVYRRAKADDPYAEQHLMEVERRIDNALTVFQKKHVQLDRHLEQHLPGITVKLSESQKPLVISLNFSTPHANFGARLVGEYDLLVRKVESCSRLGLLNSRQRSHFLQKTRRVIRGVFSTPVQYKNMAITREDIVRETPSGKAAVLALGRPDDDILHRQKRARYGPQKSEK